MLKQNWYLLQDGKTKKKVVWEAVGEEMASKHFELGENAAQKCEQKWNNLYRKYKDYIKEWEKTGSEKGLDDLKSPYHEEILAIIGIIMNEVTTSNIDLNLYNFMVTFHRRRK